MRNSVQQDMFALAVSRPGKLERTDSAGRVIVMWRGRGEDNAAAYARWCADHPDQPAPDPA